MLSVSGNSLAGSFLCFLASRYEEHLESNFDEISHPLKQAAPRDVSYKTSINRQYANTRLPSRLNPIVFLVTTVPSTAEASI